MSEPKRGPFDAALAVLITESGRPLEEIDKAYDLIHSLTDSQYEGGIEKAIRVLEAAGKVDKKTCLAEIDDVYFHKSLDPWSTEARILGEIRRLLEALPGKEEKP